MDESFKRQLVYGGKSNPSAVYKNGVETKLGEKLTQKRSPVYFVI